LCAIPENARESILPKAAIRGLTLKMGQTSSPLQKAISFSHFFRRVTYDEMRNHSGVVAIFPSSGMGAATGPAR
jgi:hypothetical protein